MISSYFLQLSHASSHTCTSPFLPLFSSMSWVPLTRSLFGRVQCNWLWSGLVWRRRMQPLPLDPLLHLPLLPPLGQMSLLLTPWISFSICVLILVVVSTIYLMRCVRWTPELVALLAASLALVVSCLHLHLSLLRSLLLVEMMMMMMMLMVLALLVMKRWRPFNDASFVTHDKKGK